MNGYSIKSYEGEIGYNYKENFYDAIDAIDTEINSFYNTFTSIMKENEFAKEQVERWTSLIDTFYKKSIELKQKISDKYQEMWARAQKMEKWYDEARNISGEIIQEEEWPFPPSDEDTDQFREIYKVDNVGLNGDEFPAITFTRTRYHRKKNDDGNWCSWSSEIKEVRTYDIKSDADYINYVCNYQSVFSKAYVPNSITRIDPVK